jgi:CBS domain-containing protein
MKVKDIMTPAAVTEAPEDTLAEAAAKMWHEQTGSLVIMSGDSLSGILTERDLLRFVGEGGDPKQVSVSDVMSRSVVTISPEKTLHDAARIMFDKWFRHLPVVTDDGRTVGMISLRDLLYLLAEGLDEPETLQKLTGHKLVRDRRLERIEPGDLD